MGRRLGRRAGVSDGTTPGDCPDLGAALPVEADGHRWGDVNCDGSVDALDGLNVLAHKVGFELPHVGCVAIGTAITQANWS